MHQILGGRTVAVMLGALLVLSGCSGSSGPKKTDAGSCSWPKDGVAQYALAFGHTSGVRGAGAKTQHDRLLAFDVGTGRAVGDCAVTPGQLPQPAQITGDSQYPYGPDSFSTPGLPLPIGHPRLVPDNAYTGVTLHGGVRDLTDGTVTELAFTGWRVVATSGNTLLLTRDRGESTPYRTAPSDWCVLPSATATRSHCTPVPRASTPGTGGIAPDGTVHWTPLAAKTVSVHGAVLTVGRAGDATVTFVGEGSGSAAKQLPTGLDQHSIVFLPGIPGPGSASLLRWLSGADPASAAATLHSSSADADAVDQQSDPPFLAAAIDGGARLVTVSRTGQAVEYTAGGGGRHLVRLRFPAGVLNIDPLSWPSVSRAPGT